MVHGIKSSRSQGLVDFAYRFASEAHGDQKRKYTKEPYINHSVEVAQIVAEVTDDCETISAAFLHDVLEDTEVTYRELIDVGFGYPIARLVQEVTDVSKPEDGNRAERKRLDREHLAQASNRAKTLKLADLISNSINIMEHDPKFAVTYMGEKRQLLEVLVGGDETLYNKAMKIVEDYYTGEKE